MPYLLRITDKNRRETILRLENTFPGRCRWQSLIPSALCYDHGYYQNSGNDIICSVLLVGGHRQEILTLWDVRDVGATIRVGDWVVADTRRESHDPLHPRLSPSPQGMYRGTHGLNRDMVIDQQSGRGYISTAGAGILVATTFHWQRV